VRLQLSVVQQSIYIQSLHWATATTACCATVVVASMHPDRSITDLPPDVFMLIVDRLLPSFENGSLADPLNFAYLRLSSRGVRTLCDAAVRRLDLCNRTGDEMRHLLQRFSGGAPSFHLIITPLHSVRV
jgi:hypothetical protein